MFCVGKLFVAVGERGSFQLVGGGVVEAVSGDRLVLGDVVVRADRSWDASIEDWCVGNTIRFCMSVAFTILGLECGSVGANNVDLFS